CHPTQDFLSSQDDLSTPHFSTLPYQNTFECENSATDFWDEYYLENETLIDENNPFAMCTEEDRD
ncbi:MAG: hypothetical protein V1855_04430, partial [bacterium]